MPLTCVRDAAAVVEDEAHRDVPVGAGDVDRREALLRVLREQLLRVGRVLGRRRRQLRDPGRLEQVVAVGDDPRARVVRDAVASCRRTRPRPRGPSASSTSCRTTTCRAAANAPAAMYFVISVLPISITSGPPPPASVASNFCRWSPQFWYWTFTVVAGVVGLELLVRGRDDVRPAGLRVDLQPDGDAVRRRLLRRAGRRGGQRRGENDDETESDDAASLHLDAPRVRRACRSPRTVRRCEGSRRRAVGTDHLPLRRIVSHGHEDVNTNFGNWSRPRPAQGSVTCASPTGCAGWPPTPSSVTSR